MKVTTPPEALVPDAPVVALTGMPELLPLTVVILELPEAAWSRTTLPFSKLLNESRTVAVMVEAVDPSATAEAGLAVTVDVVALPTKGCAVDDAVAGAA